MVTINGGYSFANIEDRDTKGTGWRINGHGQNWNQVLD